MALGLDEKDLIDEEKEADVESTGLVHEPSETLVMYLWGELLACFIFVLANFKH